MKNLSRKSVTIFLISFIVSAIAQEGRPPLDSQKINDSFYIITDRRPSGDLSIGVNIGDDGIVVIDTMPADRKDDVVAAVKAISDKPVKYVLNTYSQESRTGANKAFQEQGAEVISAIDEYPAWLTPGDGTPDIRYSGQLNLQVNDQDIHLNQLRVHTLGDSIVQLDKSNIIFTSWAYTSEILPQSENLVRQMQAYDTIFEMADEETLIVPALGKVSNKQELSVYRRLLNDIQSKVLKLHNQGLNVDAISTHSSIRQTVNRLSNRISSEQQNLRNAETNVLRSIVSIIVLNHIHRDPLALSDVQRRDYVGTYKTDKDNTIDIIALDDRLRFGHQTTQYFTHELSSTQERDRFYIARNGTELAFQRNKDQKIQSLTINRQGRVTTANKIL